MKKNNAKNSPIKTKFSEDLFGKRFKTKLAKFVSKAMPHRPDTMQATSKPRYEAKSATMLYRIRIVSNRYAYRANMICSEYE